MFRRLTVLLLTCLSVISLSAQAEPARSFSCSGQDMGSFAIFLGEWNQEVAEYAYKELEMANGEIIQIIETQGATYRLEDQSVFKLLIQDDGSYRFEWIRGSGVISGVCQSN